MVKYNGSTSKRMSKLISVALIGMALSAAFCSSALAADELYHGNFCTPNRDHVNKIDFGQYGVLNISSSNTAFVQCPFKLPFSANLKVTNLTVTVYDRHPSADVSCKLTSVGMEGHTIWSITRSTSGAQAGHKYLTFQPPNTNVLGTLNMICSLPPLTNFGKGTSHITTYRIITTP